MNRVAISLASALLLAGCSTNPFARWSGGPSPYTPSTRAEPRAVRESVPYRERSASPKSSGDNGDAPDRSTNQGADTATREMPATSDGLPPPGQGAPTPVVTLGGDREDSADGATELVNGTWDKLSRINRSQLGSDDAALYDQAHSFLIAARQALNNKDYTAAAGFARKASTLTVKLKSSAARATPR